VQGVVAAAGGEHAGQAHLAVGPEERPATVPREAIASLRVAQRKAREPVTNEAGRQQDSNMVCGS